MLTKEVMAQFYGLHHFFYTKVSTLVQLWTDPDWLLNEAMQVITELLLSTSAVFSARLRPHPFYVTLYVSLSANHICTQDTSPSRDESINARLHWLGSILLANMLINERLNGFKLIECLRLLFLIQYEVVQIAVVGQTI